VSSGIARARGRPSRHIHGEAPDKKKKEAARLVGTVPDGFASFGGSDRAEATPAKA